ncbi:thioredoxin [Calocera viscosa TUFC12733]|uniref:Thioredoxin n=1 Tax=Calocera viscosa (strain TUFC12733) TaxID=1330018 RepID=A0A167H588_CALVF|nr:thioredoxin [Calocera viscosa TUFC12733]
MPVTALKTLQEFQDLLKQDKTIVINFYTIALEACRLFLPIFERLANTETRLTFYNVDVDRDEGRDIAWEVGIGIMPAFIIFKDGRKVDEYAGYNELNLMDMLAKHS